MAAVEGLYGAGDKRARDLKHSEALAALVAKFPADDEAQSFYALSLLAILPRGDQAAAAPPESRRHRRRRVRAQPEASRRGALHPARLRSRRAGR